MSRGKVSFSLLLLGFYGLFFGTTLFVFFCRAHGVPEVPLERRRMLVGEIAGGVHVSQTFRVNANGLSWIRIYAEAVTRRPAGQVVFELSEVVDKVPARQVFRVARPIAEVIDRDSYEIRFSPLSDSAGRTYRLDVRAPNSPRAGGLRLWANVDDIYPEGRLFFDGHELWGDLAFSVGAERATLAQDPDRFWPGLGQILPSPPLLVAAMATYSLILAGVLSTLTAATLSLRRIQEGRRGAPSAIRPRVVRLTAAVLAVAMLIVGLWLWAWRRGALDLIDTFPSAEKETSLGNLHGPFSIEWVVTASGDRKWSIWAVPTSRITWTVDVPPGASFMAFAGMREEAGKYEGDGVTFLVEIVHGGTTREVFRHHLDPFHRPGDRTWVPVRVDLGPYAGQSVRISLRTDPGPAGNGVLDASAWGEPRIECGIRIAKCGLVRNTEFGF